MHFREILLYTQNAAAQYDFYAKRLGLPCTKLSAKTFNVTIGNTVVWFNEKPGSTPYHFAINIPYPAVDDALAWIKQSVTVLKDGDSEIQPFTNWQARAMYFYDADKNIVELIGREKADYSYAGKFDVSCLKEVSEVGVPANDISPLFNKLNVEAGLEIYDGTTSRFCAIGDEYGLFICINYNEKKTWFPTNDKPNVSDFTVVVSHQDKAYKVEYIAGTLDVINTLIGTE